MNIEALKLKEQYPKNDFPEGKYHAKIVEVESPQSDRVHITYQIVSPVTYQGREVTHTYYLNPAGLSQDIARLFYSCRIDKPVDTDQLRGKELLISIKRRRSGCNPYPFPVVHSIERMPKMENDDD